MAGAGARVYSPTLGRFLQTDPIGYGDGLNWYAYVGNEPLNNSDPTGEVNFKDMLRQTWESAKVSVPALAKFALNDLGETGAAGMRVQDGTASRMDYLVAAGAIPGVKLEAKGAQVALEGAEAVTWPPFLIQP